MQPKKFKTVHRSHEPADAHSMNFTCFKNQKFLKSDRVCLWFVDALREALDKRQCALWAFCIMPDHAHLLVFPKAPTFDGSGFLFDLKKPVTDMAVEWVKANDPSFLPRMQDVQPNGKRYNRLWQRGGGYDRNIQTSEIIHVEIDYIHANPEKAGLVDKATDWRWSSARQWQGLEGGLTLCDWTDLPPRPLQHH